MPTWHRNDNSDGWGFEWKGAAGFHCVRPDFDIVVPMYAPYTRTALVSPFSHPRNISVLLRFKVDKTDGKYLIANHGAARRAPRPRAAPRRTAVQPGAGQRRASSGARRVAALPRARPDCLARHAARALGRG